MTESMLCDSGASMMQASLADGPGLPGAAVRAGGGDESTVSRLGRFKAGGVMVVPAKTTGASRTYHWKITFPSQETREAAAASSSSSPFFFSFSSSSSFHPLLFLLHASSPSLIRSFSFSSLTGFFLSSFSFFYSSVCPFLAFSTSFSCCSRLLATPSRLTSSSASCRGSSPAPPPTTLRRCRRRCTCHTLPLRESRGSATTRGRERASERERERGRENECAVYILYMSVYEA